MLKVYIQGFRGPWGWLNEFESWCKQNGEIQICNAEDADIIFQSDHENWEQNIPYLGKKVVIANVLDFAHWVGGNPKIEVYVDRFCRKATTTTGISDLVIQQLKDRGIDAKMFHYPSQVTESMIEGVRNMRKKNSIVSFSRLGDPGKRISVAVESFLNSNLPNLGWKYNLIGPESPPCLLGKGVSYLGFMDAGIMYSFVSSAMATISIENGTGLGLPAIESLLVGTLPIVRNCDGVPLFGILKGNAVYANEESDLIGILNNLGNGIYDSMLLNSKSVESWKRDVAFKLLADLIISEYALHS